MKAKYLIQITANNPMLTNNGFFTIDGAMTRAVADEKALLLREAELFARKDNPRAIRVISAIKWRAEHSANNRMLMRGDK